MKQTIVMAVMLMALMACKNSQTQVAEIIDLPRAETPDSLAQAMEGFFQKAAADSYDGVVAKIITTDYVKEELEGRPHAVEA